MCGKSLNFDLFVLCLGAEGFTSETDQDEVRKIERQLKNRFPIGSHVSEQRIVQDFLKQVSKHPLAGSHSYSTQ